MAVTWDPATSHTSIILTNGNLTASKNTIFDRTAIATHGVASGKVYLEVTINNFNSIFLGAQTAPFLVGGNILAGTEYFGWRGTSNDVYSYNGATVSGPGTYGTGDVLGMALDMDTNQVWFSLNGTWQGDPAAGTGSPVTGLSAGPWFPGISMNNTSSVTLNAGASAFVYPIPSGFTAYGGSAPVETQVFLDAWTETTSFNAVTVDVLADTNVTVDTWTETVSFQDVAVQAMVNVDLAVDTWTEATNFLPMDAVVVNEVMMDAWTETTSFQDVTISAAMGITLEAWTETVQFNDITVARDLGVLIGRWTESISFNPINLTNNPGRLYTRFYNFKALTLAVGSHIEYELDAISDSFPALDDLIAEVDDTNQIIIDDAVEQAEIAVGRVELDEATAFAAAATASEISAADWAELARRYAEETAGTEVQNGDYSSRHHTEMGGQAFQIEPSQGSILTPGRNYAFPAGAANKTLALAPSNPGDVICIGIRDTDGTTVLLDGVGAVTIEGNPTFTLDQNINYIVSDETGGWLVLRDLP